MTASSMIKQYIHELPEGKSFPSSSLRAFSTTDNIRQLLNRLVKAGEIKRVARGVFVKPKQSALVGEILPSAFEIAVSLSKSTGETITVQGAEAARMLQLTTQVPMQPIFYTSGNTRVLKFNNTKVKLKHVNPSRLIAPGTTPGLVICALNFVGRKNVTPNTIEKIKSVITEKEFIQTTQLSDKMPAWMADVFYRYQKENIHA
ncbi:MAG: hypothetical protein COY58_08250 [Gammaproteobacteria bacterium CG_4_10_14_0_8_um_filter_38_16]|nr:MAG: hypothetical protein COY58_08250 [Gammaproteobacteria bacterium CG_4_10_14_0_8_um_filter_38_16]PJA04265.1 MAG: hypothetical protein COX72_00745 [Gammaproteobacteria bacterium CG_4_10_14_0_2_um_filter_38_22]PJB09621.1 MAG: hypothetical protein CO120_09145 [Gammaproteobacteria bacterium CG_4_9_14_3_um_filter_38_9]